MLMAKGSTSKKIFDLVASFINAEIRPGLTQEPLVEVEPEATEV